MMLPLRRDSPSTRCLHGDWEYVVRAHEVAHGGSKMLVPLGGEGHCQLRRWRGILEDESSPAFNHDRLHCVQKPRHRRLQA